MIDWRKNTRAKNPQPGRLLVGYRKCDWSCVFAMPIPEAELDSDMTPEIGFYCRDSGPAGYREPMESEIHWLPHFAPPKEEANKKAECDRRQKQLIGDVWRYLNEENWNMVLQLDEELHHPRHQRWQSVFESAKKFKHERRKKKNNSHAASEARKLRSQLMGIKERYPSLEIDLPYEGSSDIDEGYGDEQAEEEEEDFPIRARKASGPPMAPPRYQSSASRHRRKRSLSNDSSRKRDKADGSTKHHGNGRAATPYSNMFMSSPWGPGRPSSQVLYRTSSPSVLGRPFSNDYEDEEDNDSSSTGTYRGPDPLRRSCGATPCKSQINSNNFNDKALQDHSENLDLETVSQHNGNLSEDQALAKAQEKSKDPGELKGFDMNGGMSEQEAIDKAMRLSRPPDEQTRNASNVDTGEE